MHVTADTFLRSILGILPTRRRVCELGSHEVNGRIRDNFPSGILYVGVDIREGPGVDFVGDAASWRPAEGVTFDTALACELFEHAPEAGKICRTLYDILEPGGVAIVTTAADPREPHSGEDGGPLREGEYYKNVSPSSLREWLKPFAHVLLDTSHAGDLYALAVR